MKKIRLSYMFGARSGRLVSGTAADGSLIIEKVFRHTTKSPEKTTSIGHKMAVRMEIFQGEMEMIRAPGNGVARQNLYKSIRDLCC